MKRTRRKFSREFKISVIRELENGKTYAQVCREHEIHPSMIAKWKREYRGDPDNAFKGSGNVCELQARNAELERMVGQLFMEVTFLKKTLATLEAKLQELRRKKEQS